MIKRFAALLAASSVKINTVQCVPVKYNTFLVYNKDSRLNKGSYLQMGLIKRFKPCLFSSVLYIYICR